LFLRVGIRVGIVICVFAFTPSAAKIREPERGRYFIPAVQASHFVLLSLIGVHGHPRLHTLMQCKNRDNTTNREIIEFFNIETR
jgi:hypothetical protein